MANKLFAEYSEGDPRAWTIMIDPAGASVFCTCYINDPYFGDNYFELHDGGQYLPNRLRLQTSSFEVLIEHLVKHGIRGTERVVAA